MEKKRKKVPVPAWMLAAQKKLKPGTCYWEPFRGLTKIQRLTIDETGDGNPILTMEGVTMELHPTDGVPRPRNVVDHFSREYDIKQVLKNKKSPRALLNMHTRYWKKIYF